MDMLVREDKTLLEQIINHKSVDPTEYVLQQLFYPMIECYFNLIMNSGIQPEWHAQNLLIGFTKDFVPVKLIMRDLESMDKDLTFMERINLNVQFKSYPFKCIWKDNWNYQIKHSFMYDYKFGEYILQPLLDFLENTYGVNTLELLPEIKQFSKKFIDTFPEDFFPQNKWYVFEKVLIDQTTDKRPYIELTNPKFRF
jgi:siderophore synthetase component